MEKIETEQAKMKNPVQESVSTMASFISSSEVKPKANKYNEYWTKLMDMGIPYKEE